MHNTGEGGLAAAHKLGGELVFQIGTGYFGCRDERGRFSLERLLERVAEAPVRAIEIKLSRGAKPGLGGLLPAPKVTEEIARIRGVPPFHDWRSGARVPLAPTLGWVYATRRRSASTRSSQTEPAWWRR